jgi:hypothetical protein
MRPYPQRARWNRPSLGTSVGQLAGDLLRLVARVPRGGVAVAQDIWGGILWGDDHCGPAGHGTCHGGCHRFTVECYPMLPRGCSGPCGHH